MKGGEVIVSGRSDGKGIERGDRVRQTPIICLVPLCPFYQR